MYINPNFYIETIMQDKRFHSISKVIDVNLLEPGTRAAVLKVIKDALMVYKVVLAVTETYRSAERQKQLFEEKLTELPTLGVHHYGLAADFCKVVDGKPTWAGDWSFLGELCEKYSLVWGGNWNQPEAEHAFVDADHVQRINVSDQDKLFAGSWYPADSYNPV